MCDEYKTNHLPHDCVAIKSLECLLGFVEYADSILIDDFGHSLFFEWGIATARKNEADGVVARGLAEDWSAGKGVYRTITSGSVKGLRFLEREPLCD